MLCYVLSSQKKVGGFGTKNHDNLGLVGFVCTFFLCICTFFMLYESAFFTFGVYVILAKMSTFFT